MRYTRYLAGCALAAGMLFAGSSNLSAQDRSDFRHDNRRVDALRADIARDRARLNEDIRRGRRAAARRDAADLERDQRALSFQMRDVRRDWR